jgi:hypothetical protein
MDYHNLPFLFHPNVFSLGIIYAIIFLCNYMVFLFHISFSLVAYVVLVKKPSLIMRMLFN